MSWTRPLSGHAPVVTKRCSPLGEEAKKHIRSTVSQAKAHGLDVLASVLNDLADQYGRSVYDIGRIARIYKWQH